MHHAILPWHKQGAWEAKVEGCVGGKGGRVRGRQRWKGAWEAKVEGCVGGKGGRVRGRQRWKGAAHLTVSPLRQTGEPLSVYACARARVCVCVCTAQGVFWTGGLLAPVFMSLAVRFFFLVLGFFFPRCICLDSSQPHAPSGPHYTPLHPIALPPPTLTWGLTLPFII